MIIDLARLKSKLGLDPADTSPDEDLTLLVTEQTAWVEGETHRRFGPPVLVTETIVGRGRVEMFLSGHIEVGVTAHPEWGIVLVMERVAYTQASEVDDTAYDVRAGNSLASLVRTDGSVWSVGAEYDVTYYDGYDDAPDDIESLIYSLVTSAYRMDQSTADASAGITSESLVGVYSYSIDRQHATLEASGELSSMSQKTINRWKRILV